MAALVFAGLPTINILQPFFPTRLNVSPYSLNILAFFLIKSALSSPFYLGLEPTNIIKSAFLNPTAGSESIS